MSRPLRIEYPGAWYDVMNRGRRGEEIFTEKNDYEAINVRPTQLTIKQSVLQRVKCVGLTPVSAHNGGSA